MVGTFVFETGGSLSVFTHLAYLPILLAAMFWGVWGGVVTGVIAGLIMGPLMPLDVVRGIEQEPQIWLFRMSAFAGFGLLAGFTLTRLRSLAMKVLRASYIDDLTGIPNKTCMGQVLDRMVRGGERVGMCVVAVNAYRAISGAFGSELAEAMLRRAVDRLERIAPPGAMIFRLHGDQFGLIVPGARSESLVERMIEGLEPPVMVAGHPFLLDASVGMTEAEDARKDANVLIYQASLAAHDAFARKRSWESYAQVDADEHRSRLRLLAEFRTALAQNELFMLYQPQVRLSDGAVVGCEALVRWRHGRQGVLCPSSFIPFVESSGLMTKLTSEVVGQVVRQIAAWTREGVNVPVAVNVSARDLSDPDFCNTVLSLVEQAEIDRRQIEIEVTESTPFYRGSVALHNLRRLREAGMRVSIDDYGTGLSSLTYLKDIPAHTVKIDQSFISEIVADDHDRVLVESTIQLCHRLDKVVVAEGVDEGATVAALAEMGCDLAQGYYFSKPVTAAEFAALYHRAPWQAEMPWRG